MKAIKTNKSRKSALGFIFSVVLLDVMGLGLLMPIQAYIVRQYSQEAIMVAMIPVLYAAAQFFAAPLLGKLSDRFGRRPVILYSITVSAFGYFLFGIGGGALADATSKRTAMVSAYALQAAACFVIPTVWGTSARSLIVLIFVIAALGQIVTPAVKAATALVTT